MLTIWGRKTSSNVQALMWCVGELGLAWRPQIALGAHPLDGAEWNPASL